MSITKQYLKTKPFCKVTFLLNNLTASSVAVVGDFNAWDPTKNQLKKLKNGTFKATLNFPKETSYEFRYLIDGEFSNDAEADRFQWNAYANTENSVLEL